MLQVVASVVLVVSGAYLTLVAQATPGLRAFGWVLVLVGVLGLVSAVLLRERHR